jgi:predicted NAD/FAD-binding protein
MESEMGMELPPDGWAGLFDLAVAAMAAAAALLLLTAPTDAEDTEDAERPT